MNAESSKLQQEIETYQQNASTMSEFERAKKEEELGMKQQRLLEKKDGLIASLDEEQDKYNEELHNRLGTFMKEYNKTKNYSYVLGFQKGGSILFANDSLNITDEVVEKLNEAYEKENKKE